MAQAWVGTSGWQYDDWRGPFYPAGLAKSRWFTYYERVFPTVEVNASFYRLPRLTTTTKWHTRAPAGFRFAAKGSRYVTHNRKLLHPAEGVGNVMERFAPMRGSLAVVLWQLPPNLHKDVPRLDAFLAVLPEWTRHAVEFRHPSWVNDEVFATLERHRAAHVWVSSNRMPPNRTLTGGLCYLRFHGLGSAAYDYRAPELAPWVAAVRGAVEAGSEAYVYFNNDVTCKAPPNALLFVEMLGDAAVTWPPPGSGDAQMRVDEVDQPVVHGAAPAEHRVALPPGQREELA